MTKAPIDLGIAKASRAEAFATEIDAVKAQIPEDMEKAIRLAKDSGAVGFMTLVVMGNGEVTMFQNTRITNVYHMVGAIEVAKARLLK